MFISFKEVQYAYFFSFSPWLISKSLSFSPQTSSTSFTYNPFIRKILLCRYTGWDTELDFKHQEFKIKLDMVCEIKSH